MLDFWHVCSYIGKMADALFAARNEGRARSGFTKMRQWLKEPPPRERHRWHARRCNIWSRRKMTKPQKTGVLEGIPLPTSAPPLDGLRGLPAAWLADRQRRDRGGRARRYSRSVSGVRSMRWSHEAGQVILDLARGVPERNLGRGIQNRLAFAGSCRSRAALLGESPTRGVIQATRQVSARLAA